MSDLSQLSVAELLQEHAALLVELKARGVLRTKNNPVADYTEWLVSRSLGLVLLGNSSPGCDARDSEGIRYQIKGRRSTPDNASMQLGAIRNLPEGQFDVLIGVMFNADWSVRYAAAIPHALVAQLARYRRHTNGWVVHLRRSVLEVAGVKDLTGALTAPS